MIKTNNDNRAILSQLLDFYHDQFNLNHTTLPGLVAVVMMISFGIFCYSVYAVLNSESPSTSPYGIVAIVSIFFACLLSTYVTRTLCVYRCEYDVWNTLSGQATEPIVWRLDGDEWTQYLEYVSGPNRWANQFIDYTLRCWYDRKIARLAAQGFGYIVFVENACIVDKLFICELDTSPVSCAHLITFPNQQLVLRMYIRPDAEFMTSGQIIDVHTLIQYCDLFIPKALYEPRQRLERMVELMNTEPNSLRDSFHSFPQIQALFEPLRV